jgi:hypothetical protein
LVLKFNPSLVEVNFAFWSGCISILNGKLSLKNISENSLSKINRIFKYSEFGFFCIDLDRNENSVRPSYKDLDMALVILEIICWLKLDCNWGMSFLSNGSRNLQIIDTDIFGTKNLITKLGKTYIWQQYVLASLLLTIVTISELDLFWRIVTIYWQKLSITGN